MSRYNHFHKTTNMDRLIRAFFFIVGVALLGFLCPREKTLTLQYTLNEPWEGDALIAKDTFNIMLSDSSYEKRKAKILNEYEPYFTYLPEVADSQVTTVFRHLDSICASHSVPLEQRREAFLVLKRNYEGYVLPDSSYNKLQNKNIRCVHIHWGNEGEIVEISKLKSVKMVYNQLMKQKSEIHDVFAKAKLQKYIHPNLRYSVEKNAEKLREKLGVLSYCAGSVKAGEKIVDKGEIVDVATAEKLQSFIKHENGRMKTTAEEWSQVGGQVLYIALMVLALMMFFFQFRNDYINSLRHSLLIWLLCIIFPLLTYIDVQCDWGNVYVIPYCMLPILIRVFMDSRTAFISHLVCILLSAIAVPDPYEFLTIQTLAGLTAIYSLKQLQQRSDLFVAVLAVITASLLTKLCFDLVHMNFFNTRGVNLDDYLSIAAGGAFLLPSYLLLFPIEKLFKFTSTVTLVELSNINNDVLRKLSEEAAGTFQHSMQVANLSAEVANKLGANAQLVRTGALYHDIGKLKSPAFFTENQSGTNPHSTMPFEDSAQIIIQHVKYGLELAQKYRLPDSVKKFIASHHGRSKTKFFYISYVNQNPGKEVNDEIFTYPGPNPASLEEAILMMADAVEAASRSLSEYTEESISNLVDRIIDSQVSEGMFNHCPITFENIETAKQTFKNKLKSIYHTRISYPELKKG